MTCSDFLDRYSDFRDDDLLADEADRFRHHLAACSSCRRYDRTLLVGTTILREAQPLQPREDFQERIRFAIYRDDLEARRHGSGLLVRGMVVGVGVAATVAAVMAMALLREASPVAELAPVATSTPDLFGESLSTSLFDPLPSDPSTFEEMDFLAGSNVLLYENSPLFRRHREPEILMAELR